MSILRLSSQTATQVSLSWFFVGTQFFTVEKEGKAVLTLTKGLAIFSLVYLFALAPSAYADDAAGDWNSSMGFRTPSEVANAFNAAEIMYRYSKGGTGAGGGMILCQVAGACPNGGTVTQWNGVSVTTVSGSSGITIDNTIDADADQDSDIAACTDVDSCNTNF